MGRRLISRPAASPWRWLGRGVLGVGAATLLTVVVSNILVEASARGRLYQSASAVPQRSVGLLLGTSKYTGRGRINPYYQYRIDAALALYQAGKIDELIVSGDNAHASYDEPTQMRADLIALGIPAQHLHRDYAGFRTLDSVVRAGKVFGQVKFTVISQRFHNQRAIYLAQANGFDAIGFDAQAVSGGWRVQLREWLARTAAVLDVLRGKQPRFLGEPIQVSGRPGGDTQN